MMKKYFALLVVVSLFACDHDDNVADRRSFYMGFSPWPYDASIEATDWVYNRLNTDGDIISHHLEEGVPWVEALNNQPYPQSFQNELISRRSRHVPGKKVLVQVNPLNISRTGLAPYRGSAVNMALPSPWNSLAINSPEVKQAYLNYSKYIIDFFKPDYLLIGVEVNLLIRNNPSLWDSYVELHKYIYTEIKKSNPALPISASVFCVPYFPEWSPGDNLTAQKNGLTDIANHLDILSFSIHPFMSGLLAESVPDNYFEELFNVTTKPVAISESSYPAQQWSTISTPVLTFKGTPAKQKAFLEKMLSAADKANTEFVIWFAVRDYDALWNGVLNQSETALIWRDTGLFDESGNPRIAYDSWSEWFRKMRH